MGWDWASESHDVSVVDQDGKVVFRTEVEHTEAGLESILRRLRTFGEPAQLPVAIERLSAGSSSACWSPAAAPTRWPRASGVAGGRKPDG